MAHSRICRTVNKPARATTTTIRILGSHTDSVLVASQVSGGIFLFFSVCVLDLCIMRGEAAIKDESASFKFKDIRSAFTLKYNGKYRSGMKNAF